MNGCREPVASTGCDRRVTRNDRARPSRLEPRRPRSAPADRFALSCPARTAALPSGVSALDCPARTARKTRPNPIDPRLRAVSAPGAGKSSILFLDIYCALRPGLPHMRVIWILKSVGAAGAIGIR